MFDVYILMFMSAILIYLAINYKFNKQEFDKQISNSSKNRISKEYLVKIKKETEDEVKKALSLAKLI